MLNIPTKDEVVPAERWEFNQDVTAAFDDMLQRSIPQYDVMRTIVFNLACRYARPDTYIVDLGSSRGEALSALVEKFGRQNKYFAVDISKPMLCALVARFKPYIADGTMRVKRMDLRRQYPSVHNSVTLAILTLQFTPIEYRARILNRIYDNLAPAGAFIFVEKILGDSADTDDLMVEEYYKIKVDHGYSQEQIIRKKHSLEGVLVPVTAKWNEEMLRKAGFRHIECVWRWMNFAAWIAVK